MADGRIFGTETKVFYSSGRWKTADSESQKQKSIMWAIWGLRHPSEIDWLAPGTLENVSMQVALSKHYEGAKGRMKMADLPNS